MGAIDQSESNFLFFLQASSLAEQMTCVGLPSLYTYFPQATIFLLICQ
jgi:hypothetical protein